jgi:hypothetical protein
LLSAAAQLLQPRSFLKHRVVPLKEPLLAFCVCLPLSAGGLSSGLCCQFVCLLLLLRVKGCQLSFLLGGARFVLGHPPQALLLLALQG